MSYSNYEEIYEIIKKNGPISFSGIGKILQMRYHFSERDWRDSKHSEIAGYLSSLSQNGLIKNVSTGKSGIRKTPAVKIWSAK